jgi:hypothetical protein
MHVGRTSTFRAPACRYRGSKYHRPDFIPPDRTTRLIRPGGVDDPDSHVPVGSVILVHGRHADGDAALPHYISQHIASSARTHPLKRITRQHLDMLPPRRWMIHLGHDSKKSPSILACTTCKARRHRHPLSISRARSRSSVPNCRGRLGPLTLGE